MILQQPLDDINFEYGDTSDGDTHDEQYVEEHRHEHEGYGYDEQYDEHGGDEYDDYESSYNSYNDIDNGFDNNQYNIDQYQDEN